jgi:hypothetical protein
MNGNACDRSSRFLEETSQIMSITFIGDVGREIALESKMGPGWLSPHIKWISRCTVTPTVFVRMRQEAVFLKGRKPVQEW